METTNSTASRSLCGEKQFIIITSIFSPTEAIKKFSQVENHQLIVIGDRKTPNKWASENTIFLSVDDQDKLNYNINSLLPYNHYARKNIGYIHAIKSGAGTIIDTDDDNIPYQDWSFPNFDGSYPTVRNRNGFVNIYSYYSQQKIWPRGLPLDLINATESKIVQDDLKEEEVKVGIWQGLADKDPDVDAIYRLVDNMVCTFAKNGNIVLPAATVSPFNSQNTSFRKELFPLLYIPSTVTMRFSDILRGLVAQPIMWLYGYKLGITEATVYQERNDHDFTRDFTEEIPCYLQGKKIIEIVEGVIDSRFSITDNLYSGYEALHKNEIVSSDELNVLKSWIKDVS